MNLTHLGHDVWLMYGMPFGVGQSVYFGATNKTFTDFLKDKKNERRYLLASTNDFNQPKSCEILKENNFKEIVTYKSQHGGKQTITLWLKVCPDAPDLSKKKKYLTGSNCSLSVHRSMFTKCSLTVKKNAADILFNYTRIGQTPAYAKIKKFNIIKRTKLFPRKKFLGLI